MILTVTVNPMMEHLYRVPGFAAGGRFRPDCACKVIPTGKPLNVARALRDLGEPVRSVVAVGGATGREIEEKLEREGLDTCTVVLRQESRRGFTVYDENGQTTTIYGPSPEVSRAEVDALVATVQSMLPARLLVLGGSIPHPDLLARLCELEVPVVLDAKGPALIQAMEVGNVFLAKPNLQECQETFGIQTAEEGIKALRRAGARWAVVTQGAGEAMFALGRHTYLARPPEVTALHTVGCGDALCAGLLHAMCRPPKEAIAFAVACGVYAATRPDIAHLDRDAVNKLAAEVEVEERGCDRERVQARAS